MKSLLVANTLYTTAGKKPTEVTKHALAIIDGATGLTVAKVSAVTGTMYRFVVGLGDNTCIEGVWLKKADFKAPTTVSPVVGTAKVLKIVTPELIPHTIGADAELHIMVDPKNAFCAEDKRDFVASVVADSTTQTATEITNTLIAEAQKVISNINELYGVTFTLATVDGGYTLTCSDKNLDFNVSVGGCLKAVVTVATPATLPQGQGYQIAQMEKDLAVATAGYNPNFEEGDKAYGNIFVADTTKGYYIATLVSAVDNTDQMPLHEKGAYVEQVLACAVTFGTTFLA